MDGQLQHALHVPQSEAQAVRKSIEKAGQWDHGYRLRKDDNSSLLALPIKTECFSQVKEDWPQYSISKIMLPKSTRSKVRLKSPAQILKRSVTELCNVHGLCIDNLLSEIPCKWERHGDLVSLPAQAFSSPSWALLGSELWTTVASALSCQRLAHASTITDNGFRSSKVTLLLGESGVVTHVDNRIQYQYDVTKCMFSAGNISEKLRVSKFDCTGETVVDLFAGIGYFTLPYLVHAKASHVHACEWNPTALEALRTNIQLNGVAHRCTIHPGDNRQLELKAVADRVNLGLIPSSESAWPVAVQVLKPTGGVLHIHSNVTTVTNSVVHIPRAIGNNGEAHHMPDLGPATYDTKIKNSTVTEDLSQHPTSADSDSPGGRTDSLHCGECHNAFGKVLDHTAASVSSSSSGSHHRDGTRIDKLNFPSTSCVTQNRNLSGVSNIERNNKDTMTQKSREKDLSEAGGTFSQREMRKCEVPSKNVNFDEKTIVDSRDSLSQAESKQQSPKNTVHSFCSKWSAEVSSKILSMLTDQKGGHWSVKPLHCELVKSYAPHVLHVVLDLDCRPVSA